MIESLAYVGITTSSHEQWDHFGTQILGLERGPDGPDGARRFRMDDALYRLAIHPGDRDDVAYFGWSVQTSESARQIADNVEAAGLDVSGGDPETAELRGVEGFLWFIDPFGFRHEISWGQLFLPNSFRPGRAHSGFKTGEQGVGHVVLLVPDLVAADEFFRGVLGFKLSDRIIEGKLNARFYHVNGRHHSLAVGQAPVTGLQHLMLESNSLDDVGTALDLARKNGHPIMSDLGRHTNDLMTSFYVRTPSHFDIEYGFGGVAVDDLWVPRTYHRTSIWGHGRDPRNAGLPMGLITRVPEPAAAS
jgi:extradiol dioxygenase